MLTSVKRGYIRAGAEFLRAHDGIRCIAERDIICDVQPGPSRGGRVVVEYVERDTWSGAMTTRRATVYSRDVKHS